MAAQRLRRRQFYLRNGYAQTGYLVELSAQKQEILLPNGAFDPEACFAFFPKYSNGAMRPPIFRAKGGIQRRTGRPENPGSRDAPSLSFYSAQATRSRPFMAHRRWAASSMPRRSAGVSRAPASGQNARTSSALPRRTASMRPAKRSPRSTGST